MATNPSVEERQNKTILQWVEFLCWKWTFLSSFQSLEVSHNFWISFFKSFTAWQNLPKCNFLSHSTCPVTKPWKVRQQWVQIERSLPSIIMKMKNMGNSHSIPSKSCEEKMRGRQVIVFSFADGWGAMALRQRLTELQLKMEQCWGDIWKGWHWEWKVRD